MKNEKRAPFLVSFFLRWHSPFRGGFGFGLLLPRRTSGGGSLVSLGVTILSPPPPHRGEARSGGGSVTQPWLGKGWRAGAGREAAKFVGGDRNRMHDMAYLSSAVAVLSLCH